MVTAMVSAYPSGGDWRTVLVLGTESRSVQHSVDQILSALSIEIEMARSMAVHLKLD
jgi:hypothetical protein